MKVAGAVKRVKVAGMIKGVNLADLVKAVILAGLVQDVITKSNTTILQCLNHSASCKVTTAVSENQLCTAASEFPYSAGLAYPCFARMAPSL